MFVISNSNSFIPQILKVVSPLGEKSFISVPWDLHYKRITIPKLQNSRSAHLELLSDI